MRGRSRQTPRRRVRGSPAPPVVVWGGGVMGWGAGVGWWGDGVVWGGVGWGGANDGYHTFGGDPGERRAATHIYIYIYI